MLKHVFFFFFFLPQFYSCKELNYISRADVCCHIYEGGNGQHECALQGSGSKCNRVAMLSAGPPRPEKLFYSTLHLQTDSRFTVLNCRKRDRLGVRCFRLGGLGCGVILPGENNITACVKDIWQQPCCTSAVKSLKSGWLNTVLSLFGNSSTLVFHEKGLSHILWKVKLKADDADVKSDMFYFLL